MLEAQVAAECIQVLGTNGEMRPAAESPSPLGRDHRTVVSGAAHVAEGLVQLLREAGLEAQALSWTEEERLRAAEQIVWIALPRDPFADGVPSPLIIRLLAGIPGPWWQRRESHTAWALIRELPTRGGVGRTAAPSPGARRLAGGECAAGSPRLKTRCFPNYNRDSRNRARAAARHPKRIYAAEAVT